MGTRKEFLATSAGAAALTLGATSAPTVSAAAANATVLDLATFRVHIASNAKHRQAIGAARVNDGSVFQFAVNTLNGFENGWSEPPANVQVALVLFGSACTLGLDDTAWQAHKLAELVKRVPNEWLNVDATQHNPWAHAPTTAGTRGDSSIPALLKRGVKIFVCNTALGDFANRIVAAGTTAGAGTDAFAIQAHLRERVLPGLEIVPAGISSVAVLQENGYSYFSAAL
jgi:intracellular sulfur oxidation DsrE/DsrF family protein